MISVFNLDIGLTIGKWKKCMGTSERTVKFVSKRINLFLIHHDSPSLWVLRAGQLTLLCRDYEKARSLCVFILGFDGEFFDDSPVLRRPAARIWI